MKLSSFLAYCSAGLFIGLASLAEAKDLSIIYVPLDNRPVNYTYVEQTMSAAGCKVIMPPEKYIASHTNNGNPEALWNWLITKAPKADAAVISTDSLIYGGLVASRTHNIPLETLKKRADHLNELERSLPIKLYVFSTIMRTPRSSKGSVEPPYYDKYGSKIFSYSELVDKSDQHRLSYVEQLQKAMLKKQIPQEYLSDWLTRREKNYEINTRLLNFAKRSKFHFFAIGKDDNAPFSHTHMEAAHLNGQGFAFSKKEFSIIDGVDQLGLLLMARAYNESNQKAPKIFPLYSEGVGQGTLPQYSDTRLQDSVPQQIIASGAEIASDIAAADFVLAINSPDDGIVKDSVAKSNKYYASLPNKRYIARLMELARQGKKISLADISYSNGGDNGFMHNFAKAGGLESIIAYNGWNTADNAIGYAIAQGTLAKATPQLELEKLVKQRLIDDWFYQSNARNKITQRFEKNTREDLKYSLGTLNKYIAKDAYTNCLQLSEQYSFTKGLKYRLTFPWDRLFEVNIEIKK